MAITPTGSVTNNIPVNGDYLVGDGGNGGLTVDAGSVFSVTTPNAANEPLLAFGFTAGATGTGTITGAGSKIVLSSLGGTSAPGGVNIGRTGNGAVVITAGGALVVEDLVGASFDEATFNGGEFMNVGRGAGATGSLGLDAGSVSIRGTATSLQVGRDGGNGSLQVQNGSSFLLESRIAAGDTTFNVGRDANGATGAQGTFLLDNSSFTMTGGGAAATATYSYGAYFQVGRGSATANGLAILQNNAVMTLNGYNAGIGSQTFGDAAVNIGRADATGQLLVATGADLILNAGTEGGSINVGRFGTSGEPTGPATGTMVVRGAGSTALVDSLGFANLNVARGVNNGTVTVDQGGALTLRGDLGANVNLGFRFSGDSGNGGSGALNVESGATVIVESQHASNGAGMELGSFGGSGAVTVDGAGSVLRFQSLTGVSTAIGFSNSQFNAAVNTSGGSGTLRVQNGGLLEWIVGPTDFSMAIGRGAGSSGLVEVLSGGRIDLTDNATLGAYVAIGDRINTTSAMLRVSGTNSVFEGANIIQVGRNQFDVNSTGGAGQAIVEAGGRISTNGFNVGAGGVVSGHNGTIQVAAPASLSLFETGQIGDNANAIQTLNVDGKLGLTGGVLHFDAGAAGTDRINVTGDIFFATPSGPNPQPSIIVDAVGGYKFTAGESRMLMQGQSLSSASIDPTVTVTGQATNFSYFLGVLGPIVGPKALYIEALNSGLSGGAAVFDFGAASTVGATLSYDALAGDGAAIGGRVWTGFPGQLKNITGVAGTDLGDNLNFGGTGSGASGFTIDARGGADIVFGSAGADVINGGAGADVLRGGRGADNLTGGADSDLFYFTASELTGGVIDTVNDGGISTTDFIRIDGAQYYALAVAATAGGARITFDGGQGFIDALGVGTNPLVIGTSPTVVDHTTLTAASRANLQINVIDWANTQAYAKYTELYNASGQLERQFGNYDGTNGSWDFLYDVAGVQSAYATRFDYFNAAGQLIQTVGTYDTPQSGAYSYIVSYDPANTQPFTTTTAYFNAGGQAIQTQSFYDVGGSGITNFDPDNLYAYSSYTTYYDSLGRADQTNGTYDGTNGSFYVNFDQEDIYPWTSLTVIYDQFNVVTQQWYTMPDGSIVYL
ncbi:MAG: hypothetical protein JNK46_19280 [Methylobacteriaceae bacterium]|nr:hypothetical protein [Methylobacteriaceae bacterium]